MAQGKKQGSKKKAGSEKGSISVPVKFVIPDDIRTLYSDGLFVSVSHGSFILSFVQTNQPLVATRDDIRALTEAESMCVARISFSPERMAAALDVLNQQFQAFLASQRASEANES